MNKSLIIAATALVLILTSPLTHAHRAWVKPSTTAVSGDSEWITFDAAIANGIFHPDHFAYPVERLSVVSPAGQPVTIQHQQKLRYRSVFDVELTETGTYKVFTASQSLMAFWQDEDGERHRWPGRGETASVEDFYDSVPQDARDLMVMETANRLEVYVTLGAPTSQTNTLTGKGLELKALTHPNDAYTGEDIAFQFFMNGEAAEGTKVTVVKDGEKYRDTAAGLETTADSKGNITLQFDEPGMYWLEAELEDDKVSPPAMKRRASYVLVFEVLSL
ncbi:DUF4198 domain-containing protein [Alteromonas gilva]|uniref:DUF4198 domain-containing protein n=1 Tax=Alteromonas gilva TaxID=2987522 RepID=A0ABT5L654_9ALTE|nr:DUF4198 domain-containing protein [Alteromonas gilva]MDC8832514.1 DUF4198 domain-containing protein [Alteromonas gilva]